jgi:hypothetical protein
MSPCDKREQDLGWGQSHVGAVCLVLNLPICTVDAVLILTGSWNLTASDFTDLWC